MLELGGVLVDADGLDVSVVGIEVEVNLLELFDESCLVVIMVVVAVVVNVLVVVLIDVVVLVEVVSIDVVVVVVELAQVV